MAITQTPRGLLKPDGNERVKDGDNAIAANAQKTDDLIAARESADEKLAARVGLAEAKIDAGAGGAGLSADPDRPGLYYFAGPTITPDAAHPGLFTF